MGRVASTSPVVLSAAIANSDRVPSEYLLIDDDADDAAFVHSILAEQDAYTIEWRSSYDAGCAALATGTFDVVLVDYRLGQRDGVELIRDFVHGSGGTTPAILLTGQGDRDVDLQAIEAGAADYLNKHALSGELLDRSLRYSLRHAEAMRLVREREHVFCTLLENASDAILVLDAAGTIRLASDSVQSVLGVQPNGLVGERFIDAVDPASRDLLARALQRSVAAPGRPIEANYEASAADGNDRFYQTIFVNRLGDPMIGGVVVTARDVTAERRADGQRAHMASIVASSRDAILSRSVDGTITSWNASATLLYGYESNEVVGRKMSAIFPEDTPYTNAELMARLVRGEIVQPYETRRRHKNGRLIPVIVSVSPIVDDRGTLLGLSSLARDISADKLAEHERVERAREYRSLFEASPIGLTLTGLDGRWSRVNERMASMLGYAPHELENRPAVSCLHPDDALDYAHRQELLVSGAVPRIDREERYLTKDGTLMWARTRVHLHRDQEGRPQYLIAAVEDISARKASEQQLRLTLDQLRALVAHLPVSLWALDRQGTITFSDGLLLNQSGVSPGHLVGRSQFELYSAYPSIIDATRKAIEGHELHLIERIGAYTYETWYRPMTDDAGNLTGTIGIALDITERLRLDEEIRQAHKMDAIGRLAGGVAHDFNNLLTVMNGYASMLLHAKGSRPPEDNEALEEILRAGEQSAALTQQLLAFSRRQVVQPEPVDLNHIVHEFDRIIQRLIGERIRVVTDLCHDPACITADRAQIQQLLLNLAVNARDAMPNGGTLTISTREMLLPPDASHHPNTKCVCLTVADSGTGMSSEVLEHIFEPFFTTKEMGRGTGLGLAVVHGVVQQNGGAIECHSQPSVGTTFHMFFPIAAASPDPVELALTHHAGGGEVVLVVEDEHSVRRIIETVLGDAGYIVLAASNLEEAVQIAARCQAIDLLVTDVVLPGASGVVVADHLARAVPDLRVMLMSGYPEDELSRHGLTGKEFRYLQKPFVSTQLLSAVRKALK